jgi:hypothetical protein
MATDHGSVDDTPDFASATVGTNSLHAMTIVLQDISATMTDNHKGRT